MNAIVLALGVALVYGSADFLGGLATRRVAAIAVVVWSQAIGLAVLLAVLPLLGGSPQPADLAWGVACGFAGSFAVLLLYRGLAIGTMGAVSPVTAVLAAAVPVAFAFARGERPPLLAYAGIACAFIAVVLVSAAMPPAAVERDAQLARIAPRRRFPPGVAEALGAGTAFGLLFIGFSQMRAEAGLTPMLAMRLTSLGLLVGVSLALRRSLRVSPDSMRTIGAAGALDMAANVLFLFATHAGALAIVAVISSLYPAATVALAAIVLHERLLRAQWAGVAIAFVGVVCLALAH